MKEKIGIVGIGYVGGAVFAWFKKKPVYLKLYDKYKKLGSLKEIDKETDIVFISVPTPYYKGKGYNDSALHEVITSLRAPKIIVVKSTVLPGSTEKFQKKYPRHTFLFNPEFLVAKTAVRDFLRPHRQIVGYTKKSKKVAKRILSLLPTAPVTRIMPATEAEIVKYFGNAFLATKVVFANQIYDICDRLKVDYEIVKEATANDSRIGESHLKIFHDGYRGYSGGCFLKDVKALLDFSRYIGAPSELLHEVDVLNERLLRGNKSR
ncbi:MAG: hypothetical protein Q8P97_01760 [bacterium]|nr:hypothetical protein [bacterium]